MRSTPLLPTGSARAFARRGVSLLLVLSVGTSLISIGSVTQAQEPRATFHTQKGFRARITTVPGLYIATYQTPEGKILVYLPGDLHAAESVTGTMRLEPKGKEEALRSANIAALSAYHIQWGGQSQAAQETPLTWMLPAAEPLNAGNLTLTDALDHPLAQAEFPAAAPLPPSPSDTGATANAQTPGSAGADKINLPRKGIVGRPLILQGPVNEDAPTYQVLVGDKPARLLAASPRLLIVESPTGVLGKTTLRVRKDDQTIAESAFQNDRVPRKINPWPYVIGATVVLGIMTALAAKSFSDHFGDGLSNRYPF